MSIVDLRSDNSNAVQVAFDAKNKVHVQNFKGNVSVLGANKGDNTPAVINVFPEVLIQANKGFTIDTYLKAYIAGEAGDTQFLGLSIATNVRISGEWYSLGNTGRMLCVNRTTGGLCSHISKKYLSFENLFNRGYIQKHVAYPIQVELVGACHADAQALVNYAVSEGITLPSGNTGVASVVDQNYTTVIIEETN